MRHRSTLGDRMNDFTTADPLPTVLMQCDGCRAQYHIAIGYPIGSCGKCGARTFSPVESDKEDDEEV